MIKKFVTDWTKNESKIRKIFSKNYPNSYDEILTTVISFLGEDNEGNTPDPNRVHKINDGDYQGTLLFVIGANDYQPNAYWYVKIYYGSCSLCDILTGIKENTNHKQKVNDYMTLALHFVQNIKKMR